MFNNEVKKGIKKMEVELTFTEEILGSVNSNPDIHKQFISSKAPDAKTREEEVAAIGVDAVEMREKTVFYRADGKPCVADYQIKGFFKAAGKAMNRINGSETKKVKAFKTIVREGIIDVQPRWIPFEYEGEIGDCQRPLRAETQQGERVALANSETLPAGTKIRFTITDLTGTNLEMIREWLEYGEYSGLGQWRNSGKGRFTWREIVD